MPDATGLPSIKGRSGSLVKRFLMGHAAMNAGRREKKYPCPNVAKAGAIQRQGAKGAAVVIACNDGVNKKGAHKGALDSF
jgi:hypothetical protein